MMDVGSLEGLRILYQFIGTYSQSRYLSDFPKPNPPMLSFAEVLALGIENVEVTWGVSLSESGVYLTQVMNCPGASLAERPKRPNEAGEIFVIIISSLPPD
jgi:hypothetical protein